MIDDLSGSTGGSVEALSADGSVVVGAGNRPFLAKEAFYWTGSTGSVQLGDLAGGGLESAATGVSADGSVIVGAATSADRREAAYWNPAGDLVPLGVLPTGPDSTATGVSGDGSVIVGYGGSYVGNGEFNNQQAFRWTQAEGMQPLGGATSHATAVSADGSTIVGRSANEAFRWTLEDGMVGLGSLTPFDSPRSTALDVSADGSLVVGYSYNRSGEQEAVLWDGVDGIRSLRQVLILLGLDVWDHHFIEAIGVSDDGTRIAGRMIKPSGSYAYFIASIPEPGTGTLVGLGLGLAAACRRRTRTSAAT